MLELDDETRYELSGGVGNMHEETVLDIALRSSRRLSEASARACEWAKNNRPQHRKNSREAMQRMRARNKAAALAVAMSGVREKGEADVLREKIVAAVDSFRAPVIQIRRASAG